MDSLPNISPAELNHVGEAARWGRAAFVRALPLGCALIAVGLPGSVLLTCEWASGPSRVNEPLLAAAFILLAGLALWGVLWIRFALRARAYGLQAAIEGPGWQPSVTGPVPMPQLEEALKRSGNPTGSPWLGRPFLTVQLRVGPIRVAAPFVLAADLWRLRPLKVSCLLLTWPRPRPPIPRRASTLLVGVRAAE